VKSVSPKSVRARAGRGRPNAKRIATAARDDDDLDSELRELVDGLVAALLDVI